MMPDVAEMLLAMTDPDAVPRDRYQHPLVRGTPYRRVSAVAKATDGVGGLMNWAGLMVLMGMLADSSLLTRAFSVRDDLDALKRIREEAFRLGGGRRGAELGTAVHKLCADVDLGRLDPAAIPDDTTRRDVTTYAETIRAKRIEPVGVEFYVADDHRKIAGTVDRLLKLPDDRLVVGDIKTGKSDLKWYLGPACIQMAGYANATPRAPDGTELDGWPEGFDPTVGALVHLPQGADRCEVVGLDLTKGRAGLDLALDVLRWRDDVEQLIIRHRR